MPFIQIITRLREHLQAESNEFEALQREAKRLAKELREHQDEIQRVENECVNIRPLLQVLFASYFS